MISRILIFMLGLLLLSCSSRPSDNPFTKSSVDQETITSDRSFDKFIRDFSDDISFQLTRIKFPLAYIFQDEETGEMVTIHISKKEWKAINLIGNGGFEEEVTISKSTKNSNTKNILIQGVDTGVSVTYRFEKEKGVWYLTKIIDQSN